jgi:SOUL heme-binding protein
MKSITIVITVLIVVFVFFQSFTLMSAKHTEEQKYTVLHQDAEFEIRFYPSAIMATIKSDARSYKELSGPGFRSLAGYIFGGNQEQASIPMTAPVHMDINDSLSSMSFVMPSAYNTSNLPKPNDTGIIIKKSEDEYVAAIRFGGFASDKDIKFYTEKLQRILSEKGIKTSGHFRYLGYNPPYQLVGRRNEIIVTVEWNTQKTG